MNATVLVVDDEERIRSSLRGILNDEGFRVLDTGDAPGVMAIIAREHPEVVLLDVWMPELDGIELLRRIKAEQPATHVIMISGHANIQNAVAATRLGAEDFIEKPFSVAGLLASIGRVLSGETGGSRGPEAVFDGTVVGRERTAPASLVARPQRTIKESLVIAGQGLHSGLKTGVILHPAQANAGIVFSSLADQSAIAARLENVTETGYNTTLSGNGHSIRTVEHLMSALHGLGITNLLVIQAGAGDEFIRIEPADRLIIDYTLDYPQPIGVQRVHFELTSPDDYVTQIAPARTFGFVREFHKLAQMGLASGGRLDNLILVDDEKVVNTTLRFPDEFARHKILDLIGDLFLLGRPIIGHVTASKTGHSDNLALLRAIAAAA